MKKFIIIVIIALAIFFIIKKDESKEIRVRVIPSDNSSEAYEIKKMVKNDIDQILSILLDSEMSYEEMDRVISQNVLKIDEYFKKYDAVVAYDYYNFPAKTYNGSVMKSVRCKTLLIEIKDASGDNWWGTLYPSLLGISSEEKIEYRSFIIDLFGGEK